MEHSNNKFTKQEKELKQFLHEDPIPGLTQFEVDTLTQRVLGQIPKTEKKKWYQWQPAYRIGITVVSILIAVSFLITDFNIDNNENIELSELESSYFIDMEDYEYEEMVVEAIEVGSISESDIIEKLLPVDKDELFDLEDEYIDEDIDSYIEDIDEDEADRILRKMDELGYPDLQEV